jgi:molybdopterin-guanine dinucleotide biosynthesis protein A
VSGRIGAVVLAGGRSSRFGGDKLAVSLDGRPILDHAVEAVVAVDPGVEVVVVGAPGVERALPDGVRYVRDERAYEGPLAGVATGLAALSPDVDRVLVTGGDMPWLVPSVLRLLLDALSQDSALGAAVLRADDGVRPLPMAVRRAPAAAVARAMLADGERRLLALFDGLATARLEPATWRELDPGGATVRDVDTPADLRRGGSA